VKSGAKHHPKLQDELGTVAIFPMIFSRFPCELGRFSLMSLHVPAQSIFLIVSDTSRNLDFKKLGETGPSFLLIFVVSP
jgi:hypothetical protein